MSNKYFVTFKTALGGELVYISSFVMARIRNILTIILLYYLWSAVYSTNSNVFGLGRVNVFTYIFGLIFVKAVVINSKASSLAGEISGGGLTNYLLKPMGFFKHWLVRDLVPKVLHLFFSFIEGLSLFILFRPSLFLQTDLVSLFSFTVLLVLALLTFFFLLFTISMIPFWLPEQTWPPVFLFLTTAEILAGGLFPLDVFPEYVRSLLYFTPFPYLIYVPLKMYFGAGSNLLILGSILWCITAYFLMKIVWLRGLRAYRAEGR